LRKIRTTLDILLQKIDYHYHNEAQIMLEILDSNLSKEEHKELMNFMDNHPFAKVTDLMDKPKKITSDK
jgi:hypothetical protein